MMFSSYYMDRFGHVYPNKINQDDVRVAVLNSEDAEQIERLVETMVQAKVWAVIPHDVEGAAYRAKQMQAALREFANPTPPKPDEPQGLGAVVRAACACDEEGTTFVRNGHVDPGCPWEANCGWHQYADLHAVEVLSEGVIA